MKKVLLFATAAILAASCTVSYPGVATENRIEKTGTIERTVWFGIAIKPVDLSLKSACEKNGITKVATMDYSVKYGLFRNTYKLVIQGN